MRASMIHVSALMQLLLLLLASASLRVDATNGGIAPHSRSCKLAALQLNGHAATPLFPSAHSYFYTLQDSDLNEFGVIDVDALIGVAEGAPALANAMVRVDVMTLAGARGLLTQTESVVAGDHAAIGAGRLGLAFNGAVKLKSSRHTSIVLKITHGGCRTQLYVVHVRRKSGAVAPVEPTVPDTPPQRGLCAAASVELSLASADSPSPADAWALTPAPAFDSGVRSYTFSSAGVLLSGTVALSLRVKAAAGSLVSVGVNGDSLVTLSASAVANGLAEFSGQFHADLIESEKALDVSVIVSDGSDSDSDPDSGADSGPAAECDAAEYLFSYDGAAASPPSETPLPEAPLPEQPDTPPPSGDLDVEPTVPECRIKSLVLGGGTGMSPAFFKHHFAYSCSVDPATFLTTITAITKGPVSLSARLNAGVPVALVSGVESPSWQLQSGVNVVEVTVAGEGCESTYTLQCTRAAAEGPLYNWGSSAFSACAAACPAEPGQSGGFVPGSMERSVGCFSESGAPVDDSYCAGSKPDAARDCQIECAPTPANPEVPTNPETPSNPEVPSNPESPTEPSTPTGPEVPTDPSTPTEPTEPANPTPTEPTDPANPDTPTSPENPETPLPPAPETPVEEQPPVVPGEGETGSDAAPGDVDGSTAPAAPEIPVDIGPLIPGPGDEQAGAGPNPSAGDSSLVVDGANAAARTRTGAASITVFVVAAVALIMANKQ